jgi:hypothetical protein
MAITYPGSAGGGELKIEDFKLNIHKVKKYDAAKSLLS